MVTVQAARHVILPGDCLDVLAGFADGTIDAIVTDPPYGLGFMGKAWDALPPGLPWARECLRVLKPGGHLLAFGGTRTWHRLAVAVEDAGFELRDSIAWLYGSGFPKSLDVSKAIDKAAGATREVVGTFNDNGRKVPKHQNTHGAWEGAVDVPITAPATPEAEQWSGWGTALKPAFEPIVVARKPIVGTVAANVLEHGTGALNIDATRIAHGADVDLTRQQRQTAATAGMNGLGESGFKADHVQPLYAEGGRWPANVVLDGDQAAALDQQSGTLTSGANPTRRSSDKFRNAYGDFTGQEACTPARGADSGGASRFFYCAKAPKKERPVVIDADGKAHSHPTVKPLSLMRWLVRLVTPPGGVVLDPFAGSGATIEAALLEGLTAVGIERGGPEGTPESHYFAMIQQRVERVLAATTDTEPTAQEEKDPAA